MPYPYDPSNTYLDQVAEGNPAVNTFTGAPIQTPQGDPEFPNPLIDKGVEFDFYDNAFTWEPKYQNRFLMGIGGVSAFLIKSSAKPSANNNSVTLDHINVQRYVKGKTVWNTIDISVYDAIIPSAAQELMEWFRLHHESATGRDGYSSMYKKDITLESLSPLGEVIESWKLKGAFLESVNFGSLDWATEGAVEISATLKYDWALLEF
jgi:hypothetical protein